MARTVKPVETFIPKTDQTISKLLLTVEEAAHVMSTNRNRIYQMLRDGEIMSVLIGRSRRIPYSALERWIADRISA